MIRNLVALAVGLAFGLGLCLSGMYDPQKVLGFLDIGGAWDPSLAFVMGGAIAVALLDADYFGGYNDAYGQAAGDETLLSLAAAISAAGLRSEGRLPSTRRSTSHAPAAGGAEGRLPPTRRQTSQAARKTSTLGRLPARPGR